MVTRHQIAGKAEVFDASHTGLWAWSGSSVEWRQGWKVHINVASTEIMSVLRRASSILDCFPHKIPRSFSVAMKLESGRFYGPAAGKLITVYPGTRSQTIEAVRILGDALDGFHGSFPDRDRRHDLTGAVSYRFGGARVSTNGVIGAIPVVTSPNGNRVSDRREEFVTFPPWEQDLFANSYGRDDVEAAMVGHLSEMLAAEELVYELVRRGACWVARITYLRDGNRATGIAKWGAAQLTGHAGVRRIIDECKNVDRLPAWSVPRIQERYFAADRAVMVAEDLGDSADIAALPKSIEEYNRLEQAVSTLSSTLSQHGVFISDLTLANLRWREDRLAIIDVEAPPTATGRMIHAVMAEAKRQREASLASKLLGIGEIGRPGPFPFLKQAVELRKRDLSTTVGPRDEVSAMEQDARVLTERVVTPALRSLDRPCREWSWKLAERGTCDLEQASLFRGLAGLTWTILDGGSIDTASAAARALMAQPGLMRSDGGLYFGGAGIALTVALAGTTAGDEQMARAGEQALRELGSGTATRDDLFSGQAGIVVALCGLQARGRETSDVLRTASLTLVPRLRARHDSPVRGLGYGVEGLWLASALALRYLDDDRVRDTLASALAESVSVIYAASAGPASDSLCLGRAGVASALIEVMTALPDLNIQIPAPVGTRFGGAGLCHGAAGMLLGTKPSRIRGAPAGEWQGEFQRRVICAINGTARITAGGIGWIDDRTGRLGSAFMTGSGGIVSRMLWFLGRGRLGLPHLPNEFH